MENEQEQKTSEIDRSALRPTTDEEVIESLAFGLRYEGRKRVRDADGAMARLTAERQVRLLERSGFVVMKRPDASAPSTTNHHRK